MQAIAAENNIPETAFFVPDGDGFHLRWFTPTTEVKLCGHATLAAGYVVLNLFYPQRDHVRFDTLSGRLDVTREGTKLVLDLPALPATTQHPPSIVAEALGVEPLQLWEGDRGMAVLRDSAQVRALDPDPDTVAALPFSSLIVTAAGEDDADFVSRYFAPRYGIPEDPVTGSAHCVLTPYWARVLKKKKMFARQLSSRGGELWVEDLGERIRISGECVPVIEGTLKINEP